MDKIKTFVMSKLDNTRQEIEQYIQEVAENDNSQAILNEADFRKAVAKGANFTIMVGGNIAQAGNELSDLTLLKTVKTSGGRIVPKYTRDLAYLCTYHDILITCHKAIPDDHILNNSLFYEEQQNTESSETRKFLALAFGKDVYLNLQISTSLPFDNNFHGPRLRFLNISGGMAFPSFIVRFPDRSADKLII